MLYEFCAENFTLLEKAMRAGARRIELCDNLAVGGTTVSDGVMKEAVSLAKKYDTQIMAMIRPRGGNFVYTDVEIKIMLDDIKQAQKRGVHGLVFGALTTENSLHRKQMSELIAASEGLETVCHMAFDSIPREKQFEELDWLVEQGVTRILTHGGSATQPIMEHRKHIKDILAYADHRIEILLGGGISCDNREEIATFFGVNQLHGTRVVF